ncbi:MAG: BlaI/MecI/CopY family transcriptional regulator [Chloroflexi bacterium]|nr:BlaI/MecI/CopY family transcriptional regulator [Chloroflexota bacterium]
MTEPEINTLRLDRPGVRAALGDLEAEVMEAVWRKPGNEGITVREVWEGIHAQRDIMYTTVMNTMTRLARKGLLAAERSGTAYVYQAALSRDAFVERFVGEALERLLANFSGATRAHLRRLDDPALQMRLERLLESIERRQAAEETE